MNSTSPVFQKGAAMVEMAMVVPILLILAFGIIELGRALYQHNSLGKATETAARYLTRSWGAVDDECQPLGAWDTSVAIAKNLTVYGNESGTGNPVVSGLAPVDVTVQLLAGTVTGVEDPVCYIRVESEVDFHSVFGDRIVPFMNLGPIRLSAKREMRYIGE